MDDEGKDEPKNKVHGSLDVISQEMAKKIFQENKHKLLQNEKSDIWKVISPCDDEDDFDDFERANKKKWTRDENNSYLQRKKSKKSDNNKKRNKNEMKIKSPLTNIEISSIKSKQEGKNDKMSSFKKNIIKNIFENKNIKEEKHINTSQKPKENILILESEESSKSLNINDDDSYDFNNDINQKENKIIKNIDLNIENKEQVDNDVEKMKQPIKRRTLENMKFRIKRNKTIPEEIYYSNSSKSKDNNKEKKDETSSSRKFNNELPNGEYVVKKNKIKFHTLMPKKPKQRFGSRNLLISPFSNENDFNISENRKTKNIKNLQEKVFRNIVKYKPKWTIKYFYDHEMKLQKRKETIIDKKRNIQIERENENNKSIPSINPRSIDIIIEKDSYIAIDKRSIEYNNQIKHKKILNEKLKEQRIKEMMKSNNSYILDTAETDVIYYRQKLWQKKVEDKLNKNSYKAQKQKEKEEENKFKDYKLQLCPYSKKIVENKIKYFHTVSNNNYNTKKKNVFERLYQNSKSHEKKMKELTKSYFGTLFKPNINHDFLKKNNIRAYKSTKSFNVTYQNNQKRKINNILQKKKKNFSLIIEDTSMQKSRSRNKKIKNEIMSSVESTKTSKNSSKSIKKKVSIEINSIKNKVIQSVSKEIAPIPIKLGEIKEIDSGMSDTSKRNHKKENKNIEENNINITNHSIAKNEINKNKSLNNKDNNNISNALLGKSLHKKSEEDKKPHINELIFNSEKSDSQESNHRNNANKIDRNLRRRRSSSTLSLNRFIHLFQDNNKIFNDINKFSENKATKFKEEVSFVQEKSDNENNNNNSPSFNYLQNKNNKSNITDDSMQTNKNENILKESDSFGNYNYSNLMSKDNIFKENQEKEIKRVKSKKNDNKIDRQRTKSKNNLNHIKETSKQNLRKVTNINFDPYDNQKSIDTISSEETSSVKEEEDLIQKLRNIEMKEERNKIDRIIEGKKRENINKENESENNNGIYMLNWRNTVANAIKEPFNYVDNKGIFFEFFKKN